METMKRVARCLLQQGTRMGRMRGRILPLLQGERLRTRGMDRTLVVLQPKGIQIERPIPRARLPVGQDAWLRECFSSQAYNGTRARSGSCFPKAFFSSQRPASSDNCKDPEIVIIGAGPVGVYSAILLSRYGLPCVVVDRGDGVFDLEKSMEMHPRAHVLNVRTMELLDEVGLSSDLHREMPPLDQWRYFRYATSLIGTEFGVIDHCDDRDGAYSNLRSNSHVFACHIAQPKLEYHLWKLARQSDKITFLTHHELTDIGKDGEDLVVKLRGCSDPAHVARPEETDLRCKYLIGADGSRSKVREICNIGLEGKRGIESFVSIHFKCPELAGRLNGKFAMLYFVFNPKARSTR
eukprot:764385-Hanusia_phi.AAC.1